MDNHATFPIFIFYNIHYILCVNAENKQASTKNIVKWLLFSYQRELLVKCHRFIPHNTGNVLSKANDIAFIKCVMLKDVRIKSAAMPCIDQDLYEVNASESALLVDKLPLESSKS